MKQKMIPAICYFSFIIILICEILSCGSSSASTTDSESTTVTKITPGSLDVGGGRFGNAIAFSAERVIICAYADDEDGTAAGAAYIYSIGASGLSLEQKILAGSSYSADYDQLGRSAAIFGDTAIVSASGDDDEYNYSGTAYVFSCSNGQWNLTQKLPEAGTTRNLYQAYGSSIAISSSYLIVGASGDSENGTGAVFAYIWDSVDEKWILDEKIMAGGVYTDVGGMGYSIALEGDTLVCGADGFDTQRGAAYIYSRASGSWLLVDRITAGTDSEEEAYFGSAVDISNGVVAVGAPEENSSTGAVYIFDDSGSFLQKLTPGDDYGDTGDEYGGSVAINADTLIVGARMDDADGSNSGAVYFYSKNSSNIWVFEEKLTAGTDNGAADDNLGNSVALLGDYAALGAYGDDPAGAVYFIH